MNLCVSAGAGDRGGEELQLTTSAWVPGEPSQPVDSADWEESGPFLHIDDPVELPVDVELQTFPALRIAPVAAVTLPSPEAIAQAEAEIEAARKRQEALEHPWALQTIGRRLWSSAALRMRDWTKRFSLGARYLTGNSDETTVNLQADFERQLPLASTQLQLGGNYGQSNGVRGTNRWFGTTTTDFNTDGKWIWFFKHTDEYDEFQNLDYRGMLSAGIGYRFLNEDKRRLIARLGPAGTFEVFRDPENRRATFDLFGELESRWPLRPRVQFEHKTTVYPSVEDFELFRVNTNVGLIIAIDDRECWNLQIGAQDQYISRPNPGRGPHDLWTNVSIVYQRK